MNKDFARKLVAIVSNSKKGTAAYTQQDFITSLSFKKNLIDPETVKDFLETAVKEGILVRKDGGFVPNFSTSGIIVPLDFSVTRDQLFQDSGDRPLVDRLLEAISASGKLTKKEAIARAREVLQPLKYISFETALLSVMSDEGIDIKEYLNETGARWSNHISEKKA
ncbi:MAG: DUF2240 family protein [Thermoplasmataceae archaeon]